MKAPRTGTAATWLLAGMTGVCLAMVLGLFVWLGLAGAATFWPSPVSEVTLRDGRILLGEIVAVESAARPDAGVAMRTSETARIGVSYERFEQRDLAVSTAPADAFMLELMDGRRLYGRGDADQEQAVLATAIAPAQLRTSLRSNALGFAARWTRFASEIAHFVGTAPASSNLAGGVMPALLGTLTLVVLMSLIVMPLGTATAIYLDQRRGTGARFVRIAINQLAGVPSIVYGVLGLGLLVHGVGAGIDRLFYGDRLPVPTFGSGGLLWAALTLALLTLPVVVVSIEEGLARIPPSLRQGSLALGATRQETVWNLLLPAIRPALLTGWVLAIARAAGAVAPLMLVGVVKLAPTLPLDATFPYLHPSRQFMHLGFAVYDASLASADALRGVPRAYACAGLLVGIVLVLNLSAILLRNRLRERYRALES